MFSLGEATVQIIGLQKVLEDMKSEEKKDKPVRMLPTPQNYHTADLLQTLLFPTQTLDYSQDFQKMHAHIAELQKTNVSQTISDQNETSAKSLPTMLQAA